MNRTRLVVSATVLAGALALPAVAGSAAVAAATVLGTPGAAAAVTPATATRGGLATVTTSCATLDAAAATLSGGPLRLPALMPMEAAAREGDFVVTLRLPARMRPGTYHLHVTCSDGSTATARLRVVTVRTARELAAARRAATAPGPPPWTPVSTALGIGGVALMAVGAVAGGSALALRRRARPRSRSTAVRPGRTPTLPTS